MSSATVKPDVRPVVSPPVPQDLCRLLLLRRKGSELLVACDRPPFTLPCIEIPRWERVADNLTEAVRRRYGISAICLFTPEPSDNPTCGEWTLYEAMEIREPSTGVPNKMRWLPLQSITHELFADGQDLVAIADMSGQIAGSQTGRVITPFGRPGWIEELFSWAQHEIEPYGLHLTGNIRQLNASPTFSLIRLETSTQAVWFKAVGEPNLREFPISVALSRLFPSFVPTIMATHRAWNGWLTMEFAGLRLDEAQDAQAWVRAAQHLADLQISSAAKTAELLEGHCRDLRVAYLLTLVDPFTEMMSRLMQQQPKTSPPPLDKGQLQTLGRQIKEALSDFGELNIPDTLGHLDFNPGNILCSADQCVFLDWAEAYIGPPILTLEYLHQHLVRLREDIRSQHNVVKAYQTKWLTILTPETVSAANDLAPALAVFAYATGAIAWRNLEPQQESGLTAYLRSLTRRIYFEMQKLQDRRLVCRN